MEVHPKRALDSYPMTAGPVQQQRALLAMRHGYCTAPASFEPLGSLPIQLMEKLLRLTSSCRTSSMALPLRHSHWSLCAEQGC